MAASTPEIEIDSGVGSCLVGTKPAGRACGLEPLRGPSGRHGKLLDAMPAGPRNGCMILNDYQIIISKRPHDRAHWDGMDRYIL